jgi:hypothetical protein
MKRRWWPMKLLLMTTGMIVEEPGLYQSLDESFKIFLNKGDKVPEKDNELQTLKLIK